LPNRRLFLAAGSAGAVFGALSVAAQPSPAISPELLKLIEAHRRTETVAETIGEARKVARSRFWELSKNIDFGKYCFKIEDSEKLRDQIEALSDHHEHMLEPLTTLTSPAMRERILVMWNEIRAERLTLCEKVEEIREASGLAGADRAADEVRREGEEILLKICSFPCVSLEEDMSRAVYILKTDTDLNFEQFEALRRSLADHPWAKV